MALDARPPHRAPEARMRRQWEGMGDYAASPRGPGANTPLYSYVRTSIPPSPLIKLCRLYVPRWAGGLKLIRFASAVAERNDVVEDAIETETELVDVV